MHTYLDKRMNPFLMFFNHLLYFYKTFTHISNTMSFSNEVHLNLPNSEIVLINSGYSLQFYVQRSSIYEAMHTLVIPSKVIRLI